MNNSEYELKYLTVILGDGKVLLYVASIRYHWKKKR